MLRDVEESVFHVEQTPMWTLASGRKSEPRWRTVDRALRELASRRAVLDAEEARWLREAEALQIWRPLGMVSALDYLERVLGYAPRTAQDRLRVARALGSLPQLTDALARGELPFSAVRELTRVATPATEAAWIAAAAGKNLRQVEELVADHRPGDRPDDPADPKVRSHVVRFELSAETFALLRQARALLDDEHSTNLADDAFVAALCNAVLDDAPTTEPTGRARYQIAVTLCRRCGQGWQQGAGVQVAVAAETVERAMCDAQHIGSIDGPGPERAHQDIPPSVVRFVWRRDGGRCRVPGCRSARGLEVHHIVRRADGGGHDPSGLVLLCGACHRSHHAGVLTISGTADQLEVRRPGQSQASTTHDGKSDRGARGETSHAGGGDAPHATNRSTGAHGGDVASDQRPVATSSAATGTHVGADVTSSVATRAHVGVDAMSSVATADAHAGVDSTTRSVSATGVDGGTSGVSAAALREQAKAALIGLGWRSGVAHAAVAAAATQDTEMTLERLIFESLRRCPRPKA
jgi:hypothetical protein